ncbi:hypothetical protein HRI_004923700 [Hibiscus trionum]|uniref:Uncharacterized protein n=1 Tax=Hibiscus trionum TaxID=183268 RepID=A0A9W7JDI9_HIBTR|nr:hypothetical protein HRI_004923700 [Hibiscus trionum]
MYMILNCISLVGENCISNLFCWNHFFLFFTLSKDYQDFIVSSLISAVENDKVPSVRSAACRAIGVVSCFQKTSESAEILGKFIHAVEINTSDPVVRIPASWALANICDSLRDFVGDFPLKQSTDSETHFHLVELLIECALHLAKDGDKVKSNAVRALGNLARFVGYLSSSCVDKKPVANASSELNAFDGGGIASTCPTSLKDLHWLHLFLVLQLEMSSPTVSNRLMQDPFGKQSLPFSMVNGFAMKIFPVKLTLMLNQLRIIRCSGCSSFPYALFTYLDGKFASMDARLTIIVSSMDITLTAFHQEWRGHAFGDDDDEDEDDS